MHEFVNIEVSVKWWKEMAGINGAEAFVFQNGRAVTVLRVIYR